MIFKSAAAPEATSAFIPNPSPHSVTAPVPHADRNGDHERTVDSIPKDDAEPSPKKKDSGEIPEKLGGYEVVKELGRGGMGAVYLARQISLDRPVALKVMNSQWATDPVFLARFTREAYAAAQLVHHNVVQIYDIGEQSGVNFFSMEFVEGKSLGDLVKKQGKMLPAAAVNYILQAARGLKFAHDRGMIHRDVKPDNLMLNNLGIVKVADLGLVKTSTMTRDQDAPTHVAGKTTLGKSSEHASRSGLSSLPTEMTHAGTAMGSPAYMAPEQCRDASSVDQRADIYSLGCTLYALLTGRPPFLAASVREVFIKHAKEEPVPVNRLDASIPKEVSDFCSKMLVKDTNKRFQTMDDVIRAAEGYLNGAGAGKFKPTEEHLQTLERSVEQFNSTSMSRLRTRLIQGFAGLGLLLALMGTFIDASITTICLSMVLNAFFAYFVISGLRQKTFLFRKSREVFLGSRLTDWAILIFAVILFHAALFLIGLLWIWLIGAVLGIACGLALDALIDRKVDAQRQAFLNDAQHMFKRMRLHGFEEDALREFVARYSGANWEEFYEALFGFEAKVMARPWVENEEGRAKFGVWREPILRHLDSIQNARKEARERKFLQAIEAKKLRAEGLDKKQAEEQAEAAAGRLVEQAAEIKAANVLKNNGRAGSGPRRINVKEMLANAERPAEKVSKKRVSPLETAFNLVFSWQLRFVTAALLITLSVLWVKQNLPMATATGKPADPNVTADGVMGLYSAVFESKRRWLPLQLPFGPQEIGDIFFASANALVAGLILLVSVLYRGLWIQVILLFAATIAFGGYFLPLPFPDLSPLKPYHMAMIAGAVLSIIGVLLFRKKH